MEDLNQLKNRITCKNCIYYLPPLSKCMVDGRDAFHPAADKDYFCVDKGAWAFSGDDPLLDYTNAIAQLLKTGVENG